MSGVVNDDKNLSPLKALSCIVAIDRAINIAQLLSAMNAVVK